MLNLLSFLFLLSSAHAVDIYFSPGHDCEDHIVAAINGSQHEIMVDVYSINNPRIVAALEAAHKRGIKIRILTDRTQAGGRSSLVLELIKAGLEVRVHTKNKIMHDKVGIFDGKLAINGSYNWTRPASEVNAENCAVMPEPNAITAYMKNFEELWERNTEEKSHVALLKIEAKHSKRVLDDQE